MTIRRFALALLITFLATACSTEPEAAQRAERDLSAAEEEWTTLHFAEYFEADEPIGGAWRFEPVQTEAGTNRFTRQPSSLQVTVDANESSIWWNAPLLNRPLPERYILRVMVNEPTAEQLRAGLVFWWENPQDYYSLLLGEDNTITVDRTLGSETENIFFEERTSAFQAGTNTLTVLIIEGQADVFLNNEWVTTLTHEGIGNNFAIAVETLTQTEGTVAFEAVEILAP